jgi:hypothetical protein
LLWACVCHFRLEREHPYLSVAKMPEAGRSDFV